MSLEAIFLGVSKNITADLWKEFNWDGAVKKYQASLQRQHAEIRILGKSHPVKLEGIFTELFILDELTARLRYDITKLIADYSARSDHHPDQKRIPGLKLITQKRGHRLFILGKPGAGKTTFLRYLTLRAIEGRISKVPVFISLKAWSMSDEKELLPFIVKEFEICNFPDAERFVKYILGTGEALVMFDGLDEVNQEDGQRRRLTLLLQNFAKQYPACQCLITCRIAASEYYFEGFQDVEIADFDEKQINTFMRKWFQDDKIKREAFHKAFDDKQNKAIRELGNTPILLTLLCLTFEANMGFPQHTANIYEEALDILLRQWDETRNIQRDQVYKNLTPRRKQAMFAHIAAVTFEKGDYFIKQQRLEKLIVDYLAKLTPPADEIDGQQVLKAIEVQHSLFVERTKNIYSFSHLTFQEYFTAKYITDNESRALKGLFSHLTDDRWREVFLLTASLLDEADAFFDQFRQALDNLIGNDKIIIELLDWADREAVGVDMPYKLAALKALCIYRALALALDLVLDLDLDHAHAHARALALALDLDRNLAHDRARDLALIFDLDRALDRALDRDLALDRARVLDRDRAHDLVTYLEANRLLIECLEVAYVTNRQEIEDSLLVPPGKWRIERSSSPI